MTPFNDRCVRDLDDVRTSRRIHQFVPWIENPLQDVDKPNLVFAPSHGSTMELFFDLFFVANLATFAAYHSVSSSSELLAYIGFFAIIWSTWFHIALHDVRFARDTIYARICKTIQMVFFLGFALVGPNFSPGTAEGNNTNFRLLCYVLILSRVLMAFQYFVVAIFVGKSGRTDIYVPVLLNITTYALSSIAFAAMTSAFDPATTTTPEGVYSFWWVILLIEAMFIIAVSSVWRALSLKKTYLIERMGLLTLLIIGEGAIGVTKTATSLMGKTGLMAEYLCHTILIIVMLIALWMLYFDNYSNGHYGTIRQQVWSTLHFPLHLAIVGVVEGAQQLAAAQYAYNNIETLFNNIANVCLTQHLDGSALQSQLQGIIDYYQFDKKLETLYILDELEDAIYKIGNDTGVCSPKNIASTVNGANYALPYNVTALWTEASSGIYAGLGIEMSTDQVPILTAINSCMVVFRCFWGAMILLFLCYVAALHLIRRNKADAFDWGSMIIRFVVVAVSAVFLGLSGSDALLESVVSCPANIPAALVLLLITLSADRLSAWIANRLNRKSGEPLMEVHPSHDHVYESKRIDSVTMSLVRTDTGISYNPFGGRITPNYMTTDSPTPSPHPFVQNSGKQGFPFTAGYEYKAGGHKPVHAPAHRR